jgi:hypothetical protein
MQVRHLLYDHSPQSDDTVIAETNSSVKTERNDESEIESMVGVSDLEGMKVKSESTIAGSNQKSGGGNGANSKHGEKRSVELKQSCKP